MAVEARREPRTRVVDFMMFVIWMGIEVGQGQVLDALCCMVVWLYAVCWMLVRVVGSSFESTGDHASVCMVKRR
jgi:hypothetical protein